MANAEQDAQRLGGSGKLEWVPSEVEYEVIFYGIRKDLEQDFSFKRAECNFVKLYLKLRRELFIRVSRGRQRDVIHKSNVSIAQWSIHYVDVPESHA
jgi:hypothetical protein